MKSTFKTAANSSTYASRKAGQHRLSDPLGKIGLARRQKNGRQEMNIKSIKDIK
jgi:hypothetical protein